MNIEEYKIQLEEKLDETFPKGKCKERGAALVFFYWALTLAKQLKEDDKTRS